MAFSVVYASHSFLFLLLLFVYLNTIINTIDDDNNVRTIVLEVVQGRSIACTVSFVALVSYSVILVFLALIHHCRLRSKKKKKQKRRKERKIERKKKSLLDLFLPSILYRSQEKARIRKTYIVDLTID